MAPRWSADNAAVSLPSGLPPPFGAPPCCGLDWERGGWVCFCNARSLINVFSSASLFGAGFCVGFGCDVVLGGAGGGGAGGGGSGRGGSVCGGEGCGGDGGVG